MTRGTHDNWLMTAEHIGSEGPSAIEDLDTPSWRGCEVLTHTPVDPKWSAALHDRGIRSLPYLNVGYEYASDYEPGQTPSSAVIDQLSRPLLHENYLRHDGKLIYVSCHNAPAARDTYLKRAEQIMQCGCDGLFLDNAAPSPKCWGPRFGEHTHVFADDPNARAEGHRPFCYSKAQRRYRHDVPIADEEQTYATAMLIKEIRDLVRSFCPDGRLMINGGDGSSAPPAFFDQVDSVMNEMFVYATYLDFNLPVPTDLDYQDHDIMDWLSVLEWEDQFHRRGVRMANLSSFSPHDPKRKVHALFAFCASKLWDALYYTHSSPEVDLWLRDVRLGRPLADRPGNWGAVLYREYENGLVAVNPYGVAQQANVPWADKALEVEVHCTHYELASRRQTLKPDSDGTIVVKLFPDHCLLIVPQEK